MTRHPARRPVGWGVVAAVVAATASCSSDGRELAEPVFPPPATEPATTAPTVDVLPSEPVEPTEPPATRPLEAPASGPPPSDDGGRIVFDRLYSPSNATAEVTGTGAAPGDPVTVDGSPADVLSFEIAPDGAFVAQVWVEDEGAHTLCVADTCGRVYTLAPGAETAAQVVAKIEEAIVLAREDLPYDELFPAWTVEIGGALSGTGGTTDAERRVVTVYRNRGRSVDDFVRTILHEYGHVVDAERLDDDDRAAYLELAGYPAGTAWRDPETRGIEDWARQPAEDFAEVLVAAWTARRWLPRTRAETSDELLTATLVLAGFADG